MRFRVAMFALPGFIAAVHAQTWTQLTTAATPEARIGAAMAFDVARGKAVLFGGGDFGSASFDQTWLWDGVNWTRSMPANSPSARFEHAMAYDADRGEVVLFGGYGPGTSVGSETWIWSGSTWAMRSPPSSPGARSAHAMAYDPVRKQVVLFGGYSRASTMLGDTWIWDGSNWTQVTTPVAPGASQYHLMAWDEASQSIVLFNGETWVWNGSTWTNKTSVSEVRPFGATALMVSHRGKPLLMDSKQGENRTFVWTGAAWKLLAVTSGAPAVAFMMAAYDPYQDRTVAYGGIQPPNRSNATWSFAMGNECPLSLTKWPELQALPFAGGSVQVSVPTSSGCSWTASTTDSWLSVSPASGTGSGPVTVTATPHTGSEGRTGSVKIGGVAWQFWQPSTPCPAGGSLPPGPFTIRNRCAVTYTYTASAGEEIAIRGIGRHAGNSASTALESVPAIELRDPAGVLLETAETPRYFEPVVLLPSTGAYVFPTAGTYSFQFAANGGNAGESRFEYVKSGGSCAPAVTLYGSYGAPAVPVTVGAFQKSADAWLSIGVAPGCPGVSIQAGAPWLRVSPSMAVPGYTRVEILTDLNFGGDRQASITAGSSSIAVLQSANVCTYTLSSSGRFVDDNRTTGTVTLTTSSNSCLWRASSDASWAQVYPLEGMGSASVRYTVFPNFRTKPRDATLTIGTRSFGITQYPSSGTVMERFVRLLYFSFFGRLPSAAEVAFHVNSGLTRQQLAVNFFNSDEFTGGGRLVAGLYVGLLNRDAEYGGWLFQRDALINGINAPLPLVGNFIFSREFSLRYGILTRAEFVNLLYRQVLLRQPTPAETDFHVATLDREMPRPVLAYNFLLSREFAIGTGPRLTAFLAYAGLLQRDPTAVEFAAAKGMTVADLLASILNSAEFNATLE